MDQWVDVIDGVVSRGGQGRSSLSQQPRGQGTGLLPPHPTPRLQPVAASPPTQAQPTRIKSAGKATTCLSPPAQSQPRAQSPFHHTNRTNDLPPPALPSCHRLRAIMDTDHTKPPSTPTPTCTDNCSQRHAWTHRRARHIGSAGQQAQHEALHRHHGGWLAGWILELKCCVLCGAGLAAAAAAAAVVAHTLVVGFFGRSVGSIE